MTNEERIRANAEKVIETFPDQDLAFDERSVQWVDGYIERNSEAWDEPSAVCSAVFSANMSAIILAEAGR